MENEENQSQVFHRFPQPLEIAKTRFPHSHSPGYDREEKWKSKNRIPTFPSRLLSLKKIKKGGFPWTPGSPSFRLIVRLENAVSWPPLLAASVSPQLELNIHAL